MKISLASLLLLSGSAASFQVPGLSSAESRLRMSTAKAAAEPFQKTSERIVLEELPSVFVYDHCPFCVRVRLALGIKNVKYSLRFMANDDIHTPTSLVGKKIAPIFKFPEDNLIMAESLDIVALIDSDERFGPVGAIRPFTGRTEIKAWQKSVQVLLRTLQRPRYVATGLIPEFQQLDGRHAFIKNHQLPPYEKSEWKGNDENPGMDMEKKIRLYADAMAQDPAPMIEELNAKLVELDDILYSEHYCYEGGLSYDDIDLWARLRSVTIISGIRWPEKLRAYMDNLSALGDVPLYDEMAL